MSVQNPKNNFSYIAYGDYSASQYHLIVPDQATYNYVRVASGTTVGFIGVLQNKPETGEAAEVITGGVAKVIYGARVTAGNPLTADSSGHAVAATVASSYVAGICQMNGVTSDIGLILVNPSVGIS